jgi:hypothetical protein
MKLLRRIAVVLVWCCTVFIAVIDIAAWLTIGVPHRGSEIVACIIANIMFLATLIISIVLTRVVRDSSRYEQHD